MRKIVLFDLDGTLTDSSEGIINSIRYMLKKLDLEIPDLATLQSFIGPPLGDSLERLYGLSAAESKAAVEIYREYYADHGIHQLSVYSGITEMLEALYPDYVLAVATSKPEFFAKQIIENVGLTKFFTGIFGADLAGERSNKTDVIAYALRELQETSGVMIGDRKFDIAGAKANRLKSIGVLFGFGERQELMEAEADQIVETVEELTEAIKKNFK